MTSELNDIDLVSRYSGYGALSRSGANALLGINHRGTGIPIAANTDNHGLTFFTRPRMNLSYDNLAQDRKLTPLLTTNTRSYQRAVRCLLDPMSYRDVTTIGEGTARRQTVMREVKSDLVDPYCAFIPLLTNTLLSISGWPDPMVQYYESKPGPQREVWGMIDDTMNQFGGFELQASFRNLAGDPITLLFNSWLRYAAGVYQGLLMPYPDSVLENEIDYQTRIYRLVLDPSRQYVQKIAACGAAFPLTPSLGRSFDFSSDTPFVADSASQISIPFRCYGVEYNDPILIKEFNDIVYFFNGDMGSNRSRLMVQLKPQELTLFNFYGYPYIHPRTFELQWWVYRADYEEMTRQTPVNPRESIPSGEVNRPREVVVPRNLSSTDAGLAAQLEQLNASVPRQT